MMKTHFALIEALGPEVVACGRRVGYTSYTLDARRVTCLNCQNKPAFRTALAAARAEAEAAFQAQTPRTVVPQFGRVNDDGVMECFACGGVLWRERPRSLHSYHYVCADCGQSVFPMTETGMCT